MSGRNKLKESIVFYTLAVFFPWVAFFLRDRIFSAVFSFILWIIFGYNIFAFVFQEVEFSVFL